MKRAGQQETENTRTASIYSRVQTNRQGFFKGSAVGELMRKALAQNPNLLRTLLGLSFTLIFMLSYAVYGATVSPSYYLYETDATVTVHDDIEPVRIYQEDQNQTTWTWSIPADGVNLTWVNLTAVELSNGAEVRLINSAGLFSHPLLGSQDADGFSCSDSCDYNSTHTVVAEEGGEITIKALTSTDPARRSNGTVYSNSESGAVEKARNAIAYEHSPSLIRIEIIENGNRSTAPATTIETVNEEFASLEPFSVDAATEFLWALAAVVGCFSMVLIPSFTVYFAANAKEKRDAVRLAASEKEVKDALDSDSNE
jgi:hypothetical protein|tara:strand:+ start:1750 stop:2688 length:939 start_codon:yes stop_codon:yes gene_type:complete